MSATLFLMHQFYCASGYAKQGILLKELLPKRYKTTPNKSHFLTSKTLSRLSLLTHDRKESSAYNEGEQYQSVVFNRALPSLYQKLDEQEL